MQASADGSNLRALSHGDGDLDASLSPSISPDGRRVAYTRFDYPWKGLLREPRVWEIQTVEIMGDETRSLASHTAYDMNPVWSPDGSHIAFVSRRAQDSQSRIYVMTADGGDVKAITTSTGIVDDPPAWSPDGEWLAFFGSDPDPELGPHSVYAVRADGSDQVRLGRSNIKPSWSPDGDSIIFVGYRPGDRYNPEEQPGIYTVRPDGTHLQRMDDADFAPINLKKLKYISFSPDGSKLLLSGGRIGTSGFVYTSGSDSPIWGPGSASWSPDGARIAIVGGGPSRLPARPLESLTDRAGGSHGVLFTARPDGSDPQVVAVFHRGKVISRATLDIIDQAVSNTPDPCNRLTIRARRASPECR